MRVYYDRDADLNLITNKKIAIIGYGIGGAVFHGPLVEATPGMRVAYVVTGNDERAAAAKRVHDGVSAVRSADELWARADSIDLVVVTSPFSVMPHADTIFAPSTLRACSTTGPGIGAPAQRNARSVGTVSPLAATALVRSARNGVDAIVNVTSYVRIRRTAVAGSHTSSMTALAPSRIGIIRPYMKPV